MLRSLSALPVAATIALCTVVPPLGASADALAHPTTVVSSRGGEIDVSQTSPHVVTLASNRFTCASCARRVVPKIKTLPGIAKVDFSPFVASSKRGSAPNGLIGTLTVSFDPTKTTEKAVVRAAQDALQSDPYNHAPVAIVDRTSGA